MKRTKVSFLPVNGMMAEDRPQERWIPEIGLQKINPGTGPSVNVIRPSENVFFNMGAIPASFSFMFVLFTLQFHNKFKKA